MYEYIYIHTIKDQGNDYVEHVIYLLIGEQHH